MSKMARSPGLNLIVSDFCFLTCLMFTVRSLGKNITCLGIMCVLMEIILKVTRSPINMEMNINMGCEIVPYVSQKNAFKFKNFKGKCIFENS